MGNWIDYNLSMALAGILLMGIVSGATGCFAFLQKKSLVGDMMAHSLLPGVILAFILTKTQSFEVLLIGAMLAGMLALWSMRLLENRLQLGSDAAMAWVLSAFFAFGLFLLSILQRSAFSAQAGLDKFLFGNAAAIRFEEVIWLLLLSTLILGTLWILARGFTLLSFDPSFARLIGFPVDTLDAIYRLLMLMVIALGIQWMGVVLMSALFIVPALISTLWLSQVKQILCFSAAIGAFAGTLGVLLSAHLPKSPTGPWVAMVLSFMAVVSFIFSPKVGLWSRWVLRKKLMQQRAMQDVLKAFYRHYETTGHRHRPVTLNELGQHYRGELKLEKPLLVKLIQSSMLQQVQEGTYRLTDTGFAEAARRVRLHRLWELYLQNHLHLPPDHVHEDAEIMEHIITPELEHALLQQLDNPAVDPHQSPIPGL